MNLGLKYYPLIAVLLIVPAVFSTGCLNSEKYDVEVLIDYQNIWSGTISNEEAAKSVEGYAFGRYYLTGNSFGVTIKKEDDSIYELTVSIVYEGKVLARKTTSDLYGIVSLSYTFPDKG